MQQERWSRRAGLQRKKLANKSKYDGGGRGGGDETQEMKDRKGGMTEREASTVTFRLSEWLMVPW